MDDESNKPPPRQPNRNRENDASLSTGGPPVAHERLTASQERDLVIAAECGDSEACRRLVEAFLPAIGNLARRFHGSRVERRELLQEGVAGLLFAARRYDAGLNTPFWAYASFWVRKAMQELVAELTRPVALSDRAVRELAQIRRARDEHRRMHGTEPSVADLSSRDGTDAGPAGEPPGGRAHAAQHRTARSATANPTPGPSATRSSIRAAEHAYQQVLDELEIREVRDLTDRLDERERAVIHAHYGLGTPAQTLSEIGAGLGLTAERARQIEAAGAGKLRAALSRPAPAGDAT